MAGSTTTWPAAVSERSAALVHGSPREATVLAAFPTALYLQVGGHADVLPVVTRHGLRLPMALAVATDLPTVGWGAQPGDQVVVGDGAVALPGVTIRAVRTWRPHPAPRGPPPSGQGRSRPCLYPGARRPEPSPRCSSVATTRHTHSRSGSARSWAPARDSPRAVTTSCAASSSRCGDPRGSADLVADLWRAVEPRLTSTTSLSAALLREAADGYAAEPVLRRSSASRRSGLLMTRLPSLRPSVRCRDRSHLGRRPARRSGRLPRCLVGRQAASAPGVVAPSAVAPTLPTARVTPRSMP